MSAVKSWFVKTEFGVRLGPMPDDALGELVRTGALLRADQVCEAGENDWRTASEVPGLFAADSSPSPADVAAPVVSDQSIEESPADDIATAAPHDEATNATSAVDLINEWKLERSRSTQELGLVPLAVEIAESPVEDNLSPELAAELLDDESEASPTFVTPTCTTERSSILQSVLPNQTSGIAGEPQSAAESTRQRWNRWRRSLPIAAALVAVVLATWWLWPRSQRETYDRYVALWSEWKTRRSDLKDQRGWEQFLRHAEAELDDILPGLQKSASSTDHEELLLLFIGRDCLQQMLSHPRAIGSRQERQLESLLAQAREFYEPSATPQPREAFIGAHSSPPPGAAAKPAPTKSSPGTMPLPPASAGATSESPITVPPRTNLSTSK